MGSFAQARGGDTSTPKSTPSESAAERGYRLLTTKVYLPPDFDRQVFDELWKTWEEPLKTKAAAATPAERRKMAFDRYGLTESPERPGGVALQYVDDHKGGWVMNCLACHGGTVAGKPVAGAPNTLYDLQTLTEDVSVTKLRLSKPLAHMDKGALLIPLSGSVGTTNAVMFGKLLLAYRDADLNVHIDHLPPRMISHDMDAPAWWNLKKKSNLYIDGFAPKNHRALMQFLLVVKNGPERFREWEDDYNDILVWIESLESPKYPYPIDRPLADRGQAVFNQHCATCHGTYGPGGKYPEKLVPIDEVGTDRVRLDALTVEGRVAYGRTWFNYYNTTPIKPDPGGYIAPPLDGIWASPPYLHNGSVPTLWHLLHGDARPKVWRRTPTGYDTERVGLEIEELKAVPQTHSSYERRRYFSTEDFGKSSAGHHFPDALTEDEKRAVLEYLKTL